MKSIADRFMGDCGGHVTTMFALASLVVLSMAGVASDFSHAEDERSRLQIAVDTAARAGAVPTGIAVSDRIAFAKDHFYANYRTESGHSIPPTVRIDGSTVIVSVNIDVPTTLTGLLGLKTLPVSAIGQAATVLDTRGPALAGRL